VNSASQEDGYPRVEARPVGGLDIGLDAAEWSRLIVDNPIEFDGRVEENQSSNYLSTTYVSKRKELVVVAMTPFDTPEDKESFEKLIVFHMSRK